MSRFLIELRHDEEELACAHYVKVILTYGSHFLTHVEWGCMDGVHSAWLIVEVDSKEEARAIVPPAFRSQATIVGLNNFTLEQIEHIVARHRP
jgi:hypothetical protein